MVDASPDPVDALLLAHGLRRTRASRRVLRWMLAHRESSLTHAELWQQLREPGGDALDRVTLYRLIDRFSRAGLLRCRVDASRVRRYQVVPDASAADSLRFECERCHQDRPLARALQSGAGDLEQAARSAADALQALGYRGLRLEVAVRGVCADCAAAPGAPVAGGAP